MLRKILAISFVITTMVYGHHAAAQGKSAVVDRATTADAISRAFEALDKARIDHTNKRILISAHGRFIVVSFLTADNSAYGGQAYVVYDPGQKKIVHVVGEQ